MLDLVLTLGSGTVEVPIVTTCANVVVMVVAIEYSWLLVGAARWKAVISLLGDHQHVS